MATLIYLNGVDVVYEWSQEQYKIGVSPAKIEGELEYVPVSPSLPNTYVALQ
jgi:hypothetical protein